MANQTLDSQQTVVESDVLTCAVHPNIEPSLRCNKCGRLMCNRCAVRTPVGYRCRECVRGQRKAFFNAQPADPIIQGAVSLPLAAIAAGLMGLVPGFGFFGLLIAFWAGSAAGALIADIAYRLVSKRRGEYSWLIVAACIAIGGTVGTMITGFSLTGVLFTAMAVSTAIGRLRLGR